MVFFWLGSAEVESFDINHSFLFLFMAIIRRPGIPDRLLHGSRLHLDTADHYPGTAGAAGPGHQCATVEHINFMMIGAMIIFFLIVEPHGLARLWQIAKEKLRTWPFPYG